MKSFKLYSTVLLALFMFTTLSANVSISEAKLDEIQARVNSMNYNQLVSSRKMLLQEKEGIESSSASASSSSRLAEIVAELSQIQKALIAIAGVAAVSSLTDDGYDDNVPPVITINGDNPATVELGTTYSDAGATANDAFHGSTPVIASGNVDTTAVGTYTVTYTATDLDNNTASNKNS